MANDIITQLQARNETLTQAIARYGSLNASTLHTLSFEQTKITRLTQQLANSALRREENDKQRAGLLEKTQTFAGQLGKLLNVETPDWKLPYEFQGNMVDMAAKGGMDNTARDALSLNIRDWSLAFNQDQKDLQSAAATMIEGGVSALQDLSRYMPDIAKAATASRDSAQSWAQAALATRDKLNIAPDDFRFAQNMLYSVAKSGGSVAEQTQWINAFAGKTGAQGKEGIAELTATMQIAMKNAPDAGAAAANFDHFLKSAFSKETDSWFARQGVDLQGSLLEHQQNGIGVTEAMTHIVQMQLEKMNPQILDTFRQTMKIEDLSARGDALQAMTEKFNLGAMFGDAQTRDFLAPMLANMAEYRQLKASAMQAAGQHFIDDDFAAKMTSPGEQTKALQLSLNDLWLTVGLALMAAIGELAQKHHAAGAAVQRLAAGKSGAGRRQSRAIGSEIVWQRCEKPDDAAGKRPDKRATAGRPDVYLAGSGAADEPCRPDYHRYRRRRILTLSLLGTDFRFLCRSLGAYQNRL